ncbi:MAG TPA: pyridoxal 5'-phosphate synthase glutaminase subunit PdxT [Spirochaetota bacterium]|nr:pyridoxal 5'-phosphate synthase glutaminase subunit PdxT [Spirochaetota bacterium]
MNLVKNRTVGVLAMQGAYHKHIDAIRRLGARAIEVRTAADLDSSDSLIIPGGESTTIGKLIVKNNLIIPVKKRIGEGMAVFGTCAGMILLAKSVQGMEQPLIGAMDIAVERNAYGRQIDSFETGLQVKGLAGNAMKAVFIRAPRITYTWGSVEILASYGGVPVMVRQGNLFAASFHPELTDDLRVHSLFISAVQVSEGRQFFNRSNV